MTAPISLSRLPRPSLVDAALAAMRERIASGDWPVGQRIPKETELAEMLQIGRNTVREAVRVLSHAGMIEVRQGDGTYVRALHEPATIMAQVSHTSLRDHFELRVMLETESARLAALRRTARDIRRMGAALKARGERSSSSDLARFLDLDASFHLAVAEASHNDALIPLYRYFLDAAREAALSALVEHGVTEPKLELHERLFQAIEAGDAPRAVRAARAILQPLIAAFTDGKSLGTAAARSVRKRAAQERHKA
ncbi:GntR domain protein [Gluconacetobacter diazotrophicus PA1 5]|uniref:FadR family transcriptional regulator n=4 Tax=Acetobacteraceae TaxID=433 RepID=A0A850PFQ4_9PROT|nr:MULTISPECIES: FCD domain-containing protein [Acetobacteraceae]ACI51476.1 GntR domain protein [Gluconacetobacter diazotrophicus PA1 5]MBB2157974.1 FadR family transcriptional regulator [Gluconacetobacter diazotrophicus]MBB2199071.1 FadR family transcriptional regulator [Gluconacetobacter dulcium]MBO1361076.1 FadR family transcriptional regulator [Acetobacter sacchari]MBS4076474.1 FadR family transcriptional regulator [Ameyamaea chiangmaiensis]